MRLWDLEIRCWLTNMRSLSDIISGIASLTSPQSSLRKGSEFARLEFAHALRFYSHRISIFHTFLTEWTCVREKMVFKKLFSYKNFTDWPVQWMWSCGGVDNRSNGGVDDDLLTSGTSRGGGDCEISGRSHSPLPQCRNCWCEGVRVWGCEVVRVWGCEGAHMVGEGEASYEGSPAPGGEGGGGKLGRKGLTEVRGHTECVSIDCTRKWIANAIYRLLVNFYHCLRSCPSLQRCCWKVMLLSLHPNTIVHVENVVSLFSSPSTSSQKVRKCGSHKFWPNTCEFLWFSGVAQVCRDAAGKWCCFHYTLTL